MFPWRAGNGTGGTGEGRRDACGTRFALLPLTIGEHVKAALQEAGGQRDGTECSAAEASVHAGDFLCVSAVVIQ